MHTPLAKALFLCACYYFTIGNRCTTLVGHIPYMFAAFTSLNTANIDVATVPEYIPCMISATYTCINKC